MEFHSSGAWKVSHQIKSNGRDGQSSQKHTFKKSRKIKLQFYWPRPIEPGDENINNCAKYIEKEICDEYSSSYWYSWKLQVMNMQQALKFQFEIALIFTGIIHRKEIERQVVVLNNNTTLWAKMLEVGMRLLHFLHDQCQFWRRQA